MSECEWFDSVVTWLLVIGGWLIVNYQQNHRETRKEIYHDLGLALVRLERIEKNATSYHTSEYNQMLGSEIKLDLHRFWAESEALNLVGSDALASMHSNLRRSITLNNFDTNNHVPLARADDQLAMISSCVFSLESSLKRGYRAKFH